MSHFSLAFNQALKSSGQSQTELAATIDISVAQVNRYARGRSDLRGEALGRILDAFPEQEAAELLRAFLLDKCPEGKTALVDILPRSTMVREAGPDSLALLPDNVKEMLYYLGTRCKDQVVLDLLADLERLLKGDSERVWSAVNTTLATPPDQIALEERARRNQANRDSQVKKA